MAISLKAAGTYFNLVLGNGPVVIPGSPAAGDRMFLLAFWKDYASTATTPSGWTLLGTGYADGSVGAGNGSGSVTVSVWYRDWQSGDTNPNVVLNNSADGGAAVVMLWQKGSTETWATPLTENAAWTANTAAASQTVSAAGTLAVPNNSVVMAFAGFRDDIATVTQPTSGIDVSSGITWNGNYVESPATHFSSSSALDSAGDLGHRFVTTGGTVTLRFTATLGTSETGAIKFVVQGVTSAAGGVDVDIVHGWMNPREATSEADGSSTWASLSNCLDRDNLDNTDDFTTTTVPATSQSDTLATLDYGFSIPTDATILGVEVHVLKEAASASTIYDNVVKLIKAGTLAGTSQDVAGAWDTHAGSPYTTYGGPTNLWGTTWTPAQINAADFGVGISADNTTGSAADARIGNVCVRVYYEVDGLYGVAWDTSDQIEIVRPASALNSAWAATTPTKIDDVVYWPISGDEDDLAMPTTQQSQQWTMGTPAEPLQIYKAKLWLCVRLSSGSIAIETASIRLNGTWYTTGKAIVYSTAVATKYFCFEFVDIPQVSSIGSAPAIEVTTLGSGNTSYLDVAFLELYGSGQEATFTAPNIQWIAGTTVLDSVASLTFTAPSMQWTAGTTVLDSVNSLEFTAPNIQWIAGTTVLDNANSLVFTAPVMQWTVGTSYFTFDQELTGKAGRIRLAVANETVLQHDYVLNFTAPGMAWGVGADLSHSIKAIETPSVTWGVGTFRVDMDTPYTAPGMTWGVGVSYLALNAETTFTAPGIVWAVGSNVMHQLSFIDGTSPSIAWGVGTFTPVYDQLLTFTAPSVTWGVQMYLNHDTLLTWTPPALTWNVGASVLDAETPFTAPGMAWGVGTALLEAEGQLTFTSPGPAWAVGDSTLDAIAETTFTAPGMAWAVGAVLTWENELSFTAPALTWAVGTSVVDSGTELSFTAAGMVWTVGDSTLDGVSETTFTAPGMAWAVGAVLTWENELSFTAPALTWAVGTSVVDSGTDLSFTAPGMVWAVGDVTFDAVSELTFTAPGLIWVVTSDVTGENELSFTAPGLVWTTGTNTLDTESQLVVEAPRLTFGVGVSQLVAIGEMTFTAPGLAWTISSVTLEGVQVGGIYFTRHQQLYGSSERHNAVFGASEKRASLTGTSEKHNALFETE